MITWEDIIHFEPWETRCRCGCGENNIDLLLIERIDWLRRLLAKRLNVLSGCRCQTHNRNEGGGQESFHVPWGNKRSMAIDLYPDNRAILPVIYKVAIASGKFAGIGLREHAMIHLDIGPRAYIYTYLSPGTKHLNPDILTTIRQKTMLEHLEELKKYE